MRPIKLPKQRKQKNNAMETQANEIEKEKVTKLEKTKE